MDTIQTKLSQSAPVVVRIGMAFVFLWFGFNQLLHPDLWTGYVPGYAAVFLSAGKMVLINGWFEIFGGVLLLSGIYLRIVAFVLALHLCIISSSFGFSAIGIRDIGLTVATFSIVLAGPDIYSLDWYAKRRL